MHRLINCSAHDTGLPGLSVHMIATSPPYFALRKYAGEQSVDWPAVSYSPLVGMPEITIDAMTYELGLEPSIEAYIGHMILCLREWWRVLRDDGTCWVNLGDSYAGSGGAHTHASSNPGISKSAIRSGVNCRQRGNGRGPGKKADGLKPKDLMMIPARFALAAQADGWYVRSAIVWAKGVSFLPDYAGSCMPESVRDRPVSGHEMIYLLTKSPKYFYDTEAVREESAGKLPYGNKYNFGLNDESAQGKHGNTSLFSGGSKQEYIEKYYQNGRNQRNVWVINPSGYKKAHFATYPPKLAEPMIKAGTSARGVCAECGAPWIRDTEKTGGDWERRREAGEPMRHGLNGAAASKSGNYSGTTYITKAWKTDCSCDAGEPIPATVLDPFNGSGTTGEVATALGRHYIGIDISEQYLDELTPERLANVQMEMCF
jgi:DNA modification methylase